MLSWRFLTSDSLWATYMRQRYDTKTFFAANPSPLQSGTWKHLLRCRNFSSKFIKREVADGRSTLFWHDPWLPCGPLKHAFDPPIGEELCSVADYYSSDGLWNSAPSNCDLQHILRPIHLTTGNDQWTCPTGGSFRAAWDSVRQQKAPFRFYPIVWHSKHVPKMSLLLLRCFHDKLLTKVKISEWDDTVDKKCVLCDTGQDEDSFHLFFSCPYTKYLLQRCMLKLGANPSLSDCSLKDIGEFILKSYNNKEPTDLLAKMAISALSWHIWNERNRRIFENKDKNKLLLFDDIEADTRIAVREIKLELETDKVIFSNWGISATS